MPRFCAALATLLPALLLIGCGPSGPTTHPVEGKVTVGGAPTKNIQVTFTPVGTDGTVEIASGVTDDSGVYVLYTGNQGKPGAMAGKYTVTLSEVPDPEDAGYMGGGEDNSAPAADTSKLASFSEEKEVTTGKNTIDIAVE